LTVEPNLSTIDPEMGTPIPGKGLSSALFGKTRKAVLGLLFAHPDRSFYLRQIARATGAGQGAVQRELGRLVEAGIITRSGTGRQIHFQANRECPIFAELQGLMMKTAGVSDVLRSALSPLAGELDLAFIYGSHATGSATGSSDIGLLVVGNVDEMKLHRAVSQAERQLQESVNYTLLSQDEFSRRRKAKGGFLARVLSGARIQVLGNSDQFRL
jgi:DNA-binding transcriptional ArsR family regulator